MTQLSSTMFGIFTYCVHVLNGAIVATVLSYEKAQHTKAYNYECAVKCAH